MASGNKLRKQTKIDYQPTKTIDYLGNIVYEDNAIKYILSEEGRILKNDNGAFTFNYFLKDHLGNTRVTIDQTGKLMQENAYYPFGMQINGLCFETGVDLPNQYLYNGKEFQEDFGLDWFDYGARFYDGELGRWHVVDPMAEKTFSWNPYDYTLNNPVRFVDIDGRSSSKPSGPLGNLLTWFAKKSAQLNKWIDKQVPYMSLSYDENGNYGSINSTEAAKYGLLSN